MRFSIVVRTELVPVYDPATLFEKCAEAGIPFMEVCKGMVFGDDGPMLRVEQTRRIRKARTVRVKGSPLDTPAARAGRVFQLTNVYAAIPAAHDEKAADPGYSPLDG